MGIKKLHQNHQKRKDKIHNLKAKIKVKGKVKVKKKVKRPIKKAKLKRVEKTIQGNLEKVNLENQVTNKNLLEELLLAKTVKTRKV